MTPTSGELSLHVFLVPLLFSSELRRRDLTRADFNAPLLFSANSARSAQPSPYLESSQYQQSPLISNNEALQQQIQQHLSGGMVAPTPGNSPVAMPFHSLPPQRQGHQQQQQQYQQQ